ncbi:lantibiotic biosynthesis dehydratase-like protein [Saccharothrix carnea]|uniref:Lantibiotic biosynthesis dehydratase-like protein n=1 Tax=Saccharothrix carnea TaxID=1280637 RepID=A0A2P8HID7_SACCR|nr:lantibiotic dehydratase [Saccharothrix carnea]PSL45988.1 lantibiotic biosynthesis dehydratase-like protein [Saccharothrix carnea]
MASDRITTELAPYALVRVAALAHPRPAPSGVRTGLDAVVAAEARIAALAPDLADALHDSAGGHSPAFHHRVVLPLRRDVHNGRPPRPGDFGGLPERVPLLARWLAAHEERARAVDAVLAAWPHDLAAARRWLAEVCATDALRRASVLTGPDLLHGVDRTARGRGEPDRKARKAEPTVLRYALRATAKTSPLSWYTHVGWGAWGDGPWPAAEPVSHPAVHRLLVTRLVDALGPALPHRLAPGLRERDGRLLFRRDVPVGGVGRAAVVREEEVDVAATRPLRFVVEVLRAAGPDGLAPDRIVAALAAKLGKPEGAAPFVAKTRELGLLVPVSPIHPQDPDAVGSLASWLAPTDGDTARRLRELATTTASFATADPPTRAAVLARLSAGWRDLGERVGADLTGVTPVVEDVVLPEPVPVPPGAVPALTRLTPLLVAFDQHVLLRRLIRTRFVERFGVGGVATLADCSGPLSQAWQDSMDTDRVDDPDVRAVVETRDKLAGQVRDGVVTDDVLASAADLLPAWATRRTGSYGFFAQPTHDGRLVVNRVYAGFGKFTSRFLDLLPGARDAVTRQVRRHTTDPVQFRPVQGFNANLHPLLGAREVGEDARWADLAADELDVRHDPVTDEVRVTHGGVPLDVLYLGFLIPLALPDRQVALYSDLACGWVDLDRLRTATADGEVTSQGRLTYGDIVLARRSWDFAVPPEVGAEERAGLDVARLRARHGLPEHVFVGPDRGPVSVDAYQRALTAGKPQYVDLGDPLHLRCLPRLLARFPDGVRLTEALPVPGAGGRVVELIAETYWRAS